MIGDEIFLQRFGPCLVGIVAMCLAVFLCVFCAFTVLLRCASLAFCFGTIYPGMLHFTALFLSEFCTNDIAIIDLVVARTI